MLGGRSVLEVGEVADLFVRKRQFLNYHPNRLLRLREDRGVQWVRSAFNFGTLEAAGLAGLLRRLQAVIRLPGSLRSVLPGSLVHELGPLDSLLHKRRSIYVSDLAARD